MRMPANGWTKWIAGAVATALCIGAAVAAVPLAKSLQRSHAAAADPAPADEGPKVTRVGADGLALPPEVIRSLNVQTAPAQVATRPRPLPPLTGTLGLNNDRYFRVNTLLPGRIDAVGTVSGQETDQLDTPSVDRALSHGDHVRKGQLLAVITSQQMGEKKSEFVTNLAQLIADEKELKYYQDASKTGSVPDRSIRNQSVTVQQDRVAVNKSEDTLRAYLPTREVDEVIAGLRKEAEHLAATNNSRTPSEAQRKAWARMEIRAPADGKILEKNTPLGLTVDQTVDLFKIGDPSKPTVWLNLYEEDKDEVQKLLPIRCQVRLVGSPSTPPIPAMLDRISDIGDVSQHTVLLIGRLLEAPDNLVINQAITATIDVPPPPNRVEVPISALVEDGRQSVVFVHPDPQKPEYVRKHVQVTRRYSDVAYLIGGESAAVRPGERVVTSGALLLNSALEQMPPPK
jgi:cobalt-zinc-cadmium efflux system membrane fusion protein